MRKTISGIVEVHAIDVKLVLEIDDVLVVLANVGVALVDNDLAVKSRVI